MATRVRFGALSIVAATGVGTGAVGAQPIEEIHWTVEGLSAPAEIRVDHQGVPHIYAADQDDVFFAQGFNAARDRLWQLDLWRRRGEGRLAEVFGGRFVGQDRAARLLLYRGDMYSEWLAYASDTKRIVSSFVRGVNAFIELTEERPELLSPEFEALDYRPGRWTPETVVRIRSHGLLRNGRSEVTRALLLKRHGAGAVALNDHLQPAHELEVPDGLDLADVGSGILDDYRLGTSGVDFSKLDAAVAHGDDGVRLAELVAEGRASRGSNNWAVSPARTPTGRALLADDPHRLQAVPSLRYIVHLSAPGLEVIGAGEPALPGVSIGHNGEIAFGLTIFSIDQEDVYIYEARDADPPEYAYRGRWIPMETVTELIPVRNADPVTVELRYTRHGPVISEDLERGRAFALRAAWLEPGMAPYLGSIGYMRARNWDEFLAAMNRWGAPSENQVYADTSGNIGWKPGGRAPVRANWDGLLPVPGDGRYEWSGYLDMDQLPVEYNPPRGWVATANQMNLPAGYPHQVGWEWRPPYRYDRIAEVLAADDRVSVDDAVALQADFVSLPARRVLATLGYLKGANDAQSRALDLLRDWDATLRPTSAAGAFFESWLRCCLMPAAIGAVIEADASLDSDLLDDLPRMHTENLLLLLEKPEERLGSDGEKARDDFVLESLEAAVAETESKLGADWDKWEWGDLHRVELRHPLAERLSAEHRAAAILPSLPRGGDGDTVGNTGYRSDFRQVSGASFRLVIDVGEWDNSVAMNTPGQSGDVRSAHFSDLYAPWAEDGAFALLWTRAAIEAATRTVYRLEPAR